MKRLLLSGLLLALGLATACGDNGSSDQNGSPTAGPGSPTTAAATVSESEVITATQEQQVTIRVEAPDGSMQTAAVTLKSRVDDLCADEAKWSARQADTVWRVLAECKSVEEAATPVPAGFELLQFEWIYYSDMRRVMPVSLAAHEVQYSITLPSSNPTIIIPTITPQP